MNTYFNNSPFIAALSEKSGGKSEKLVITMLVFGLVVSTTGLVVMYFEWNNYKKELNKLKGTKASGETPD